MTQNPTIENFSSIIENNLNGAKLISYKCKYLTKPGDNYGSTMLGVTANIQMLNGNIEELELVAKLPPTNPQLWDIFKPERTFITEGKFYTILAPLLFDLQIKEGDIHNENELMNVFPKCYGIRYNLNCINDVVDQNAALLLENLYTSGYKVGDRMKGFDYEHAKIIIRDLAYFHALPIALRKLRPNVFELEIKPFIRKFDVGDNITSDLKDKLKEAQKRALKKANVADSDCEQIIKLFQKSDEREKKLEECSDGPFISIVHFDFWVNNMMILYDENGKPNKTKIIDFQIAQYDSFVKDLFFFLLTSVQINVLEEKCDELLKHYYDNFIFCLKKIHCETNEYSFEGFKNEIKNISPEEIPHVIAMIRVLYMKKDNLPNLNELDPTKLADDDGVEIEFYQKLYDVIRLLKKFGWFDV